MDILGQVEAAGYWTMTTISRFIGCERGTARRMFLRGRLGAEMICRGIRSPRGQRRFADDPAFRWQLEQIRQHHNRPDSKWQEVSASRRCRIERLGRIAAGEVGTDDDDKRVAAGILHALVFLWQRRREGRDCPAVAGALDVAGQVRARHNRQDDGIPARLLLTAEMLGKSKGNTLP